MNTASFLICLCVSLSAPHRQEPDGWVGEDKAKHFVASFVATSVSASAWRTLGMSPRASALAGAGIGTAVGIWKEARDHAIAGRSASHRDLVWNLGGVAASALIMDRAR